MYSLRSSSRTQMALANTTCRLYYRSQESKCSPAGCAVFIYLSRPILPFIRLPSKICSYSFVELLRFISYCIPLSPGLSSPLSPCRANDKIHSDWEEMSLPTIK